MAGVNQHFVQDTQYSIGSCKELSYVGIVLPTGIDYRLCWFINHSTHAARLSVKCILLLSRQWELLVKSLDFVIRTLENCVLLWQFPLTLFLAILLQFLLDEELPGVEFELQSLPIFDWHLALPVHQGDNLSLALLSDWYVVCGHEPPGDSFLFPRNLSYFHREDFILIIVVGESADHGGHVGQSVEGILHSLPPHLVRTVYVYLGGTVAVWTLQLVQNGLVLLQL